MKKIKTLAIALALSLTFTACANDVANKNEESTIKETTQSIEKEDTKDSGKETSKKEDKTDTKIADIKNINGTYKGSARGYGGDVKVDVTLDKGVITDFNIDQKETGAVGSQAIDRLSQEVLDKNSTDVDKISGATVSSAAFLSAVNEALLTAGIDPDNLEKKEGKNDFKDTIDADIVVVGAGGAGLTSAISLAEDGIKVVVLEKAGITGGNSSLASGGMNAAHTKLQEKKGVPDTVELFVEDTMKGGHEINNRQLVEKMAEESSDAIDWLEEEGAALTDLKFSGGQSEMRTHAPVNEDGKSIPVGNYLVEKLTKAAKDKGVDIIYDARVDNVIMKDGKAEGVSASTKYGELTVNAKAVIIASGGFGANMDRVVEYNPNLEGYVSTNAKSIQGDAIDFLKDTDANFIDMEQIQIHPTVVQKDGSLISEGLRGEGAILVNQDGERFVNELQTRDFVSQTILEQKEPSAWLIVDQAMMDGSNTVKGYFDKGYLQKADDYKELSKIIGCKEDNIKSTMERWVEIVANDKDPDFDREGMKEGKSDLSKAPYYLVQIAPGIHHTMGGVEVNTNSEVLNKDQEVIKGLYAAGEVTGGIHGANRLGGNAVTDIVVFGRNAAKNAGEYIK